MQSLILLVLILQFKILILLDIVRWKRINKIDKDAKIFILTGGYHEFRYELERRGWIRNND